MNVLWALYLDAYHFCPHLGQIMDPRMDNGVTLSNDSKSETPPFDPQAALTPEEISWVLDRAIAAEVGSSKYQRELESDTRI